MPKESVEERRWSKQVVKQQEQYNRTQDPRDKKYLDALKGQLERAKQDRKTKKAQVTPVEKIKAALAKAQEEQKSAKEKLGDARSWLTGLEGKLQEETSSVQATPVAVEKLKYRFQLATEKVTIREGALQESTARLGKLEQGTQQARAKAQQQQEAAEQAKGQIDAAEKAKAQ